MLRRLSTYVFAVLIMCFGSVVLKADVMNYGDFESDNVIFNDVTESTGQPGLLFLEPIVNDNTLIFLPTDFKAEAENGDLDFVEGLLTFTVKAQPGTTFSSITVSEFGSYFDQGDTSFSTIFMNAFVATSQGVTNEMFQFTNIGDGNGDWNGDIKLSFAETDFAVFTLTNILFSNSAVDGVAFIGKKGIEIHVDAIKIPEPTSLGLLALAGVGLLSRRRR